MTTEPAEDTQGTEEPLRDDTVAAFLASHPDFFEHHPDLLTGLRVPHAGAGTVSLIEHQVSVLRGQLDTERRRLAHLIARARDFENLSHRLHGLTLQLIEAPDFERVESVLCDGLCKEFSAEQVSIKLFPVRSEAAEKDPLVNTFLDFLDREHSLCGPLDPERSGALFGEKDDKIASATLIPIRGEDLSGVLAVGSSDPERFRPDMGTEMLDRLGEVVSRKLRMLSAGHD